MLSIIICHRKKELLASIQKNIEATIGIPYELIVIDNTKNEYNILSAYNKGVKKANYNIICFTHEDIIFYTDNWGEKVIAHFNDPKVGMIGVLGGMAQSEIPSAWWFNNYFSKSANNLLMKNPKKKDEKIYHHYRNPFRDPDKTEVVIIDGVWFCIKKSLFNKISFDEKTFKGFHLYDADISMQVLQHAKNYVVYDILIEHLWSGTISKDFYMDLCKFAQKWQRFLPIQNEIIEKGYMRIYNWHALRSLVLEMKTKNFTRKEIVEILNKYLPVAKTKYDSKWFSSYFFISGIIGYANANRIFYRLEKLSGFCKTQNHTKVEYKSINAS